MALITRGSQAIADSREESQQGQNRTKDLAVRAVPKVGHAPMAGGDCGHDLH